MSQILGMDEDAAIRELYSPNLTDLKRRETK
jgi:hypothetical protein